MKQTISHYAYLFMLFCLVSQTLGAQKSIDQRQRVKDHFTQEQRLKKSINSFHRQKKPSRTFSGSSSVTVSLAYEVFEGAAYLLNSYGVVSQAITLKTGDSKITFSHVGEGTYTVYLTGSIRSGSRYADIVSILGTEETLVSLGEYVTVGEDDHISITLHSFKRVTSFEEEDTLFISGSLMINNTPIAKGTEIGLKYKANKMYEDKYKYFTVGEGGKISTSLKVRGDSLLAFYSNISSKGVYAASSWINGNSINGAPVIHNVINGDTIKTDINFELGATLVCTVSAPVGSTMNSRLIDCDVVSEDGYFIPHMSITSDVGNKAVKTFYGLPKGKYYVTTWYEKDAKSVYFYPNSVKKSSDAELFDVGMGSENNCIFEVNENKDSDTSYQNKDIEIEVSFKDYEGNKLSPNDCRLNFKGDYQIALYPQPTDSTLKFIVYGTKSLKVGGYSERHSALGFSWYDKASDWDNATTIHPDSNEQKFHLQMTLPAAGSVEGVIKDVAGGSLDKLDSTILSTVGDEGSVDCYFQTYLTICEQSQRLYTLDSSVFRLSGAKSGSYSNLRVLANSTQYGTEHREVAPLGMYKGGIYPITFSVEDNKSTLVNPVCPIVAGRLDFDLALDYSYLVEPLVQACLVNSDGYVVSHTYVDLQRNFSKSTNIKGQILDPCDGILKILDGGYVNYQPVSLYGIGKGEYYLMVRILTDDSFMQWYGSTEKTKVLMSDIYRIPLEKLDIPQGAKTISFETDSTWIKDFNWDITPVANMKALTQSQFQVLQSGLKLQLPVEMNNVTAKILTPTGRLVKKVVLENGGGHAIDVSNFSKGIYLLKVEGENLNFSDRISIR